MTVEDFFCRFRFGVLVAFAATPLVGWTQQADSVASRSLREVVVTATKFRAPLRYTSRPVSVISRQDIRESGAQDIAQLLQEQSGIIVNAAYGNPGQNKGLYVRGGRNEHTLILVDGIPSNDPSGLGGALDLRLLPLAQIERIEVMKGSQSSLYGSGALSGVINIITKDPDKNTIAVDGDLAIGSFGSGQGAIGVGGRTGEWRYSVGAQHFFTSGISEAVARTGSGPLFEKDEFVRTGANATIGFDLMENLTFDAYLHYAEQQGDYDGGSFVDSDINVYEGKILNTGAALVYDKEPFRARLTYGRTHNERRFDGASSFKFKGRMHDLDLYASYRISPIISVSGGLNQRLHRMLEASGDNPEPDASIFANYWNVVATPLPRAIVELSYRLNVHSQYGVNSTYSIAPSYTFANGLKAFASYNTGYKAPTLSQLYGRFAANEDLQPQTSSSWEVGAQYALLDDRLEVMATYYRRHIDDLIVYDPAGYQNRDTQRNSGIEATANWQIHPKVGLRLVYDFTTGEITERRPSLGDTTYNNLFKIPEHSLKAIATYRPIPRLLIRVSGQYMGDRKDLFFDNETFISSAVGLDAYFLLNAYLQYEAVNDRVTVFGDFNNLTGADFTEVYGYSVLPLGGRIGFQFRF